jgi:hypothetical protein
MSDFYSDMAQMARDLLAPTSAGGLGQGELKLTRVTPGTPDPLKPWLPVQPQTTTQTLKGAVRGVDSKLVGTERNGAVLLSSDLVAITEVPSIDYEAGDVFSIDGKEVTVLDVEPIPAAGIRSAVKWFLR